MYTFLYIDCRCDSNKSVYTSLYKINPYKIDDF